MLLRSLLLTLILAFPAASLAVPVTLEFLSDPDIDTGQLGSFGDFDGCAARLSCEAAGILHADFDGSVLTGVHGSLFFRDFGTVDVNDGLFDIGGHGSWLMTEQLGGFGIGSLSWGSGSLSFGVVSWNNLCQSDLCKRLRLRFAGSVTHDVPSVPEPNAALLFGLGAIAIGRRVRS